MNEKIANSLKRLFFDKGERIVFWYDREKDLRDDYEALHINGVEKIEIQNNEFGIKYRILREQPDQKFLIYHEGAQPADLDNWLLDVLLAHAEFRTDQISIWLGELELGPEYADVIKAHEDFFKAKSRIDALKGMVTQQDSPDGVRMKMLGVATRTEVRVDTVLEALLEELATERDDKISLIERCELDAFLWKRVSTDYGYQSETPGIKDFAIELFKSCYSMGVGDDYSLAKEALVFFRRWKDNRQHAEAFTALSQRYTKSLNIENDLSSRDLRSLIPLDYFELVDRRIIVELVQRLNDRTISAREVEEIIRDRRYGFWYENFDAIYQAIDYGAQFIASLEELDMTIASALDGFQRYTKYWFRVDQLYRKYTYFARISQQATLLNDLSERIENLYTNNYLLTLNNRWQEHVDTMATWEILTVKRQQRFFFEYIQPYVDAKRKLKIFVIISDALRYEVGEELTSLIRSENRFEADLDAMLTTLPNYTQLGMAALLPHEHLIIDPAKGKDVVYLDDGQDTRGTSNRSKVLSGVGGIAIQAEEFMQLSRDESREFASKHNVVYVYHNFIDDTGDARKSESQAFEAVEKTLDYLVMLIKKIHNANVYNLIVTADHGFLFQNRELEDSDYLSETSAGDNIIATDRRFVIGQGLQENPSFKTFTAKQLGIHGDFEVQIPKSINRLRQKGSGSRYVHGGASLQEIAIPVLSINVKRTSDTSKVGVSIVRGTNQVIATGQLTIKLYQEEPVTDKIQPRVLSVGLYTKDGKLISDSHEFTFDLTAQNDREREQSVRLLLSKDADTANNKNVYVRLMEQETGTSHQVEYASAEYLLRRSFTSDFDF